MQSLVKWKEHSTIVLYNEDNKELGVFQLSKGGIHLTGCIHCITPPALKGKCIKDVPTLWEVSITDGVVRIKIGGEVLYERRLRGECLERYGKVRRFAFQEMPHGSLFSFLEDEMEAGEKIGKGGCV